jgi:hypothetical protein
MTRFGDDLKMAESKTCHLHHPHICHLDRSEGAIFEVYVHSIIEPYYQGSASHFIQNPSSPRNASEELCDAAIIEDDILTLIEYKSVLMRADHKYSGDMKRIANHVQNKFVLDAATKRPKAVVLTDGFRRQPFANTEVSPLRCAPVEMTSLAGRSRRHDKG